MSAEGGPARGRRGVPARLLQAGLLALLGAVVLELVLTAAGWRARAPAAGLRERALAAARPLGRYRWDPACLFTSAPGHRWSPTHAGRDATGPWPYRGRPAEPRPPGVPLVVLLGDSGVYGSGLFPADTLAAALARALAARGLGPQRVVVSDLGVPGYTTPQIERATRRALRELHPDAVVLGTALWNERAPARGGLSQVELLDALEPGPLAQLFPALAAGIDWWRAGGDPLARALPVDDARPAGVAAAAGGPGRLVAADDARGAFLAAAEDCAAAGVPVACLVPAHPPGTLAACRGLGAEVDALRAALRAHGQEPVDGPALLARSGLDGGAAFLDPVHPSGPWNAVLADALAERLAPVLAPIAGRAAEGSGPRVLDVTPSRVPALGDVRVAVRLAGARPGTPPVVVAGEAPLLDLRLVDARAESATFTGLLGADRPGPVRLVVQDREGIAVADGLLEREAPTLEAVAAQGGGVGLLLRARPGDVLRELWWAEGGAGPGAWDRDGTVLLAGRARRLALDPLACDAEGCARLPLPDELARRGGAIALQARVGPPAEPDGRLAPGVTSAILVLGSGEAAPGDREGR